MSLAPPSHSTHTISPSHNNGSLISAISRFWESIVDTLSPYLAAVANILSSPFITLTQAFTLIHQNESRMIADSAVTTASIVADYHALSENDDQKDADFTKCRLNRQQLFDAYKLDKKLIEFKFHHYAGRYEKKESHTEFQQAIAFWMTFEHIDKLVYDAMPHLNKLEPLQYKIGPRQLANDINISFIKTAMEVIVQEATVLQQPFHIDVIGTIHNESSVQTGDEIFKNWAERYKSTDCDPFACGINIEQMAKAMNLPLAEAYTGYKELYPMGTFTSGNNKIILDKCVDEYKIDVDHVVDINDRLSVKIPKDADASDIIIKLYEISNEYSNDFRIMFTSKSKQNLHQQFKDPIQIMMKLSPDFVYNSHMKQSQSKEMFKIYWYFNELDKFFYGNKNRVRMLNNGHPEMHEKQSYVIKAEVYGFYQIYVSEQVEFLDHYIDKFCFNPKYDRDYTTLSEYDQNGFCRGGRPYYLPLGWRRYGLSIHRFDDIEKHCIAYHATSIQLLPSILRDGLCVAGTVLSSNGTLLKVPAHHIQRRKGGTKLHGDDDFTNNVFLSPSINYCTFGAYSTAYKLNKTNIRHSKYIDDTIKNDLHPTDELYAHMVLMCRVDPNKIHVNEETIGWKAHYNKEQIDPFVKNKEIEWRVRDPKDITVYGVLLKITKNHNNSTVWQTKKKLTRAKDKRHLKRDIFELHPEPEPVDEGCIIM